MTTVAEIKRWMHPLIQQRQDLALRGRALAIVPFGHIYRCLFFEGSSDRTLPRPRWYIMLPFVPRDLPVRVWSAEMPAGHSTDDGFAERLAEQFRTKIDNDLEPVSTIEAFYELTLDHRPHEAGAGLWQLERNPEYHACVLAALGRLRDASEVAQKCVAPMPLWQKKLDEGRALMSRRATSGEGRYLVSIATHKLALLSQLERLAVLAREGDRASVAVLLREWEEQKIKLWKVEDLWEPTSFPIELGAGD